MIIIHGDDTIKSRNELNNLISTARDTKREVKHLEANVLDSTLLTQVLDGTTLFGETPLVVIDGLFSLPKSKNRDNLVQVISKYTDEDLILYESKLLTPTVLKSFTRAKIKEYKPAALIFSFLEGLRPGSAVKSLQLFSALEETREPAELIFAMLVRQIRLLIQALDPASLKTAPWQKNRLVSQANAFGEDRLLSFHEKLYQIDRKLKTGKNPTNLSLQIFNLLLEL